MRSSQAVFKHGFGSSLSHRGYVLVGTHVFEAMCVKTEGVVGQGKAFEGRDAALSTFNFKVVKLFDLTAVQADQVVVVLTFIELIDRFAALKV